MGRTMHPPPTLLPTDPMVSHGCRLAIAHVLRAVSTPGEGKTCASRQGFLLWLFHQEVAEKKRHGKALLPLRRKVTGDEPPWCAGRGIPGQQSDATPVAGATHVAPSQTWGDDVALSGTVSPTQRSLGNCRGTLAPEPGVARIQTVDHACGSPGSGWRRRRRLFNAWRDTPSRPAATP
jgi:hypothetical protein